MPLGNEAKGGTRVGKIRLHKEAGHNAPQNASAIGKSSANGNDEGGIVCMRIERK